MAKRCDYCLFELNPHYGDTATRCRHHRDLPLARFRAVCSDVAMALGLPGADVDFDAHSNCWCLYEFDADNVPLRLVGTDEAEPEDKMLVRDLSWVVDELNRLAAEKETP